MKIPYTFMLKTIVLSLAVTLFSAGANAGRESCTPISFGELPQVKKLHVFEVFTICKVDSPEGKDIVELYSKGIQKRENVTILSSEEIGNNSSGREYMFSIVEEVTTNHGEMTIYGDVNVVSEIDSPFIYKHESGEIKATGAAAITKLVIETVKVFQNETDYQVKLSKVLHLKKPWYAPGGVFKKEVGKGLREDMVVIIDRHLGVLNGK